MRARAARSYRPRERRTRWTTDSMTGTSTNTPTTVESATPDWKPKKAIRGELADRPMARALSREMSMYFVRSHEERGLTFRLSQGVARICGESGRVAAVETTMGIASCRMGRACRHV